MGIRKSGILIIDEDKCNKDGICAEVCHSKIIRLRDEDSYPEIISDNEEPCIACGQCVAVCPTGALSHEQIPINDCPLIRKELAITEEQIIQFFRSRRSIRNFKDKPVEEYKLRKLVELARYAPTGFNTQSVEWQIFNEYEKIKRLKEFTVDWLQGFVKDSTGIDKKDEPWMDVLRILAPIILSSWDSGRDAIFNNAPVVLIASAPDETGSAMWDVTIALSHVELAAPIFGLGACWTGNFALPLMSSASLRKKVGIPDNNGHFFVLVAGYPQYKYKRMPERKPLKVRWNLNQI